MRFSSPKITIRRLMLLVVLAAVVLSLRDQTISALCLVVPFFWVPISLITWPFDGLFTADSRRSPTHLWIVILPPVAITWFAFVCLVASPTGLLIGLFFSALMVPPLFVGHRLRARLPITSGHAVGGWASVSLSVLLFADRGCQQVAAVQLAMIDLAWISLAISLLAPQLPSPEPADNPGIIVHYAGWILMELVVVLWGVSSARVLKYF